MQNFNSNMKAYKVNSVQCSMNIRENCPRKCFWTKAKDTRVKCNPGLSANRASNNWALGFSLNETGSFGNGIIHVVSSVRYRLYIWLIIKLRKSLRLSFADNNKVQQLYFWHKCTFQRVPKQAENLHKFQGLGGYHKHPLQCIKEIPGGGGGLKQMWTPWGYGYFLELHNKTYASCKVPSS